MRPIPKILWAMTSLLLLASCAHDDATGPIGGDDAGIPSRSDLAKAEDQVVLNNYLVQFDGRTFDGEATTFQYTVSGTGDFADLIQFRLELPAGVGDLIAFSPGSPSRIFEDEATGLTFIKWRITIAGDDTVGRQFSLTYAGDVGEGEILGGVKSAGVFEYGQVPGPGATTSYTIAGTVYNDYDADGELDFTELGIANVAVELEGAGGAVTTAVTDGEGRYSFDAAPGDYMLRLVYDGYPDAFNAQLGSTFDPTTPLEIEVTVGPDSPGNGFGFEPRTEQIVEELEGGDLASNGEDYYFWWRHFKWALLGRDHPDMVHDRAELEAFVAMIQELYLEEIFQFTPGNELEEVFEILGTRPREDIDKLRKQLLVTELNEVSGRGMVDDPALQDVLIAWGEAVWLDNQEAAALASGRHTGEGDVQDVSLARPDLIPPAIDIFTLINTGGGGGVDE